MRFFLEIAGAVMKGERFEAEGIVGEVAICSSAPFPDLPALCSFLTFVPPDTLR